MVAATALIKRGARAELAVSVRHSPVALAYGPSARPVCHLIRGVLESLVAAALGQSLEVLETSCVAMGAPACRFETS